MTVRAAALMTTALFLAPVALADVLPPKPEPAVPAAPATAPAAPGTGSEGVGGQVTPETAGDPAAAPGEGAKVEPPNPREIAANSLVQRDGTHELPGGKARIVIAEGFAFLDAADTKRLLTDVWGNPPSVGAQALGAIVPKGVSPFAEESWAAIITYEDEGHVADDDAAAINYTDLMKEMQDGTAEENKEREKAGYGTVALVGWAQEPKYDKAEHKLYWAKHLKFSGEQGDDTLNYSIRALGREGVLQVNVIGGMKQLKDINDKAPAMLSMVSFTEGNRYADYKEGDKLAAYGLAGLIAGGVAAKAGLFKLLLASWKFIAIGVIAVAGVAWRFLGGMFARKSDDGAQS
ncbi:MAG: DUF2167 domain-containing protein [Micropepsaceae bacterium]